MRQNSVPLKVIPKGCQHVFSLPSTLSIISNSCMKEAKLTDEKTKRKLGPSAYSAF